MRWCLSYCHSCKYYHIFVKIDRLLYECCSLMLCDAAALKYYSKDMCDLSSMVQHSHLSSIMMSVLAVVSSAVVNSRYISCYSMWFWWCLAGGVVYRCHLPPQQGGGVQGGSWHTGLLRHPLHHLCLCLRCHTDVPTAARDRWRAGRAPDCEGPDHHAVRQPVAPLHSLLLTGGLLPHPGLLRWQEMMKGRVGQRENMEEETKGRWVNGWILKLRLYHWSVTPSLYAIDWMTDEWMDAQMKEWRTH